MPTIDEIWAAYLTVAQDLQPLTTPTIPVQTVKGRWVRFLVDRLCTFWTRHQATLVPYLTQLAIAAMQALVAQQSAFDNVNPPGPE